MSKMIVYHGSNHIIKKPIYNGSKRYNDYGYGFYTSQNKDVTKEWAVSNDEDGYLNIYDLNIDNLKILNLNSNEYNILNWLAILTRFRTYWQNNSISQQAKKYLQDNFFVDPNDYDLIIGYRADDSYFSFAQDFISGAISLRKLSEALYLGKLGEQIVLKSKKAFNNIKYLDCELVEAKKYYDLKIKRDLEARKNYYDTKNKTDTIDDLFMIDIMRERMKGNDPRIQRIIY